MNKRRRYKAKATRARRHMKARLFAAFCRAMRGPSYAVDVLPKEVIEA